MIDKNYKKGDVLVVISHSGYDKEAPILGRNNNPVPVGSVVTVIAAKDRMEEMDDYVVYVEDYGSGVWSKDLAFPTKLERALK